MAARHFIQEQTNIHYRLDFFQEKRNDCNRKLQCLWTKIQNIHRETMGLVLLPYSKNVWCCLWLARRQDPQPYWTRWMRQGRSHSINTGAKTFHQHGVLFVLLLVSKPFQWSTTDELDLPNPSPHPHSPLATRWQMPMLQNVQAEKENWKWCTKETILSLQQKDQKCNRRMKKSAENTWKHAL